MTPAAPRRGTGPAPEPPATTAAAGLLAARLSRAGFIVLAARTLGAPLFGHLALALSIVALASQALEVTRRTFVRFGRRYEGDRHSGHLALIRRAAPALALAVAVAATTALLAASAPARSADAAVAVLALAPAALLAREAFRARQGLRRDRRHVALRLAAEPVAQLALAAGAAFVFPARAEGVAIAYVAGILVGAVVRAWPGTPVPSDHEALEGERAARLSAHASAGRGAEVRKWARYAAATAVGPASERAALHLAVLATAAAIGSEAAGLLRLAHQVADVAAALPGALQRGALLAVDPEAEDEVPFAVVRRAQWRAVLLGAPLLLGTAAAAAPIGRALAPVHAAFPIAVLLLTAGAFPRLLLGPSDALLRRAGTPRALDAVIAAGVGAALGAVALAWVLAPRLGLAGAAAALAAANSARDAALAAVLRREGGWSRPG